MLNILFLQPNLKKHKMANIDIKLSQNEVNLSNAIDIKNGPSTNGTFGTLVDAIIVANSSINKAYTSPSSWSWSGSHFVSCRQTMSTLLPSNKGVKNPFFAVARNPFVFQEIMFMFLL